MINLVVGGLGFVGKSLISRMTKDNLEVYVVDIDVWAKDDFKNANRGNFQLIKPNSSNWAEQVIAKIGDERVRIWHLAANSDISKASQHIDIDYKLTLGSTIETLRVANNVNCASIEFTSSSAVYGRRIAGAKFREDDPIDPISSYGAMKYASELMIKINSDRTNVPFHIYRLANIIGPDMTHGLIFDLINKLRTNPDKLHVLGDGSQRKTYMHVNDLVESMLQISNLNESLTINIGPGDEGLTVSKIVELVLHQFDKSVHVQFENKPNGWHGDVTDSVMDTAKLNSLNLSTPRSSEESVREAIAARLHETT